MVPYHTSRNRIRTPPNIKVFSITAWFARSMQCLIASKKTHRSENCFGKGLTRKPPRKAWEGSQVTGMLWSISTGNMKIHGKGIWNVSRNRIKFSLAWKSAWYHIVNWRIPIRSAPRNRKNMSPIAAAYLVVILIPTSLVTVSDKK